jgi:Na+/proline symporter
MLSLSVFALTIVATFIASILGHRHASASSGEGLAGEKLNKWLVGLSAGASANSGFVVTGAVGLGYVGGLPSLLIPLGWLAGDILFWLFFPQRINGAGAALGAFTLTDVLVGGLGPKARRPIKLIAATMILLCLSGYISAQWLSGQKFLLGAFGLGGIVSLVLFAAVIVIYTAIGGFRGSVYADSFQAVLRIVGTGVAFAAVLAVVRANPAAFWAEIDRAPPDFLSLLPGGSWWAMIAAIGGFGAASLGFGLGQPQIVSRYLAGASPSETRSAWWIYMGFVQFTWLSMGLFGVLLRGVMPGLHDPESGLSEFFRANMGPLLTGLIVADIFATIAATSNSLLVAMAQTVRFDLLAIPTHSCEDGKERLWAITAVIGAITMGASLLLHQSVSTMALGSVALVGAGLGPAMLATLLDWRRSGMSIGLTMVAGFASAAIWKYLGFGATLNEAAIGFAVGLVVNAAVARLGNSAGRHA